MKIRNKKMIINKAMGSRLPFAVELAVLYLTFWQSQGMIYHSSGKK